MTWTVETYCKCDWLFFLCVFFFCEWTRFFQSQFFSIKKKKNKGSNDLMDDEDYRIEMGEVVLCELYFRFFLCMCASCIANLRKQKSMCEIAQS